MTIRRRRFLAGAAALVVAPSVVAPSVPAPAVRFAAGPTLATGTVQVLLNGEVLRGPARITIAGMVFNPGPVFFRRLATDIEPEETDAELRERVRLALASRVES